LISTVVQGLGIERTRLVSDTIFLVIFLLQLDA